MLLRRRPAGVRKFSSFFHHSLLLFRSCFDPIFHGKLLFLALGRWKGLARL